MGVGESNKIKQNHATRPTYIWKANNHSSFVLRFRPWLHNTPWPCWYQEILSGWAVQSGRRADWESFCRSLERSLDVNNHDILATVPAVPGYAYPRYPQDWGDTGFGIILDNGCSKNFLNPKNRSSNAKYDQSCSFDILFDIPKPSALNAFWVKTLAAFSKVAAATSTCNWKYFPQRALTQQGQFSFAWGGVLLREVTPTKSKNDVHSTQVSSLASANAMPWYWPCKSQRHPKLNFKS